MNPYPATEFNASQINANRGLLAKPNADPPTAPNNVTNNDTDKAATAHDPNDLYGPAGYGSSNFVADNNSPVFPYRIDFENAPTATAPAQRVVVTDQLDSNLDWTTFQLTGIGFGSTAINVPANSQSYQTTVPMTYNGQTFDVDISASLNPATGLLTVIFQSIDPGTFLPPSSVLTGFLPPEDGTGRGMGYISYIIDPKQDLATGTQIRNVALVTFDANQSIATDQVNDSDPTQGIDPNKQALVTIDSGPPTSSVSPLPATETSASFTVSWSGQDDPGGSGIANYNIYVSDNGGSFTLWQNQTTQTSAIYNGVNGHTYAFYSVATDNVGNVQPTPTAAQATTTVSVPTTTPISVVSTQTLSALQGVSTGSVLLATFTQGSATQSASAYTATVAWGDGQSDTSTETNSPLSIQVSGQTISVYGSHTYTVGGPQNLSVMLSTTGTSATAYPTATVAANVTSAVSVTSGGFRYDFTNHEFVQTLTLTNTSSSALVGPLALQLLNLSSNATLANASGTANGNPYLDFQSSSGSLAAGQSITVTLYFTDPTFKAITYDTEVWQNLS